MIARTVDAKHGWRWLTQGLAIFRRSPGMWLLLVLILFAGSRVLLALPYLRFVAVLIAPVFLVGLAHGAQALTQGKPLRLGYLISGFLKNGAQLVIIGGVSLIGHYLMVMGMTAVAGDQLLAVAKISSSGVMTPETVNAMRAAAPHILLGMIVGLGISLPIMLGVWFAPLLVFFDDMRPVPAMILSLRACLKNVLPLLLYSISVMVPLFVMMQIGMALTRQPDFGVWLLAPILVPSLYASYRDLFLPAAADQ